MHSIEKALGEVELYLAKQKFWPMFSSLLVELTEPYVKLLIEDWILLPSESTRKIAEAMMMQFLDSAIINKQGIWNNFEYKVLVCNEFNQKDYEIHELIGEIIFHMSIQHRFSYSRSFLTLKGILDELPDSTLTNDLKQRFIQLESNFLSISDADMVFLNIDPLLQIFSAKSAKKSLKEHSVLVMRRIQVIHNALEKLTKEVNNFEKTYKKILQQEEQKRKAQEHERSKGMQKWTNSSVQQLSKQNFIEKNEEWTRLKYKIGKILSHIENLELKGEVLTQEQKNKLQQILEDLERKTFEFSNDWDSLCYIRFCSHRVSTIMQKDGKQDVQKMQNSSCIEDQEKYPEIKVPALSLEKNYQIITFLDNLLKTFDKNISNTVHKSNSYGDGTFVMQTLRPVLKALKNEVFLKNSIILGETFSWNEIISKLLLTFENKNPVQVNFLLALQNSHISCDSIYGLFMEMFLVIQKFSMTSAFAHGSKWDKIALKNFTQQFLQQIHSIDN